MKLSWLLPLGCLCGVSCIFASPVPSLDELRVGKVREPELVEHTTRHPHTGVLVREWSEWLLPSGQSEKHGVERTWYPSGKPEWVREFDHGEPIGHWQGWHEDGTPMAESFHGSEGPTVMRFWHSNGQLSAQGEAWNGVRNGQWTHWYANGNVREEGEYLDGFRSGTWSLFREDGSLESRGRFERGVRVGVWEDGPRTPVTDPLPEGSGLD